MRTLSLLICAVLFLSNCLLAQVNCIEKYFSIIPSYIKYNKSGTQKYNVILKWQNLDAINGNKINCNGVKAIYITGLENDSVSWENVRLSQISNFQQSEFNGTNLSSFNGFTYKINKTNFLDDNFYKKIPYELKDLAKWLVSDAIQMQGLAWYIFDSLEYNKPFTPIILNDYDVKFKDWVTFTSRYQKLIWYGIASYNNQVCAIVKFESLYNPVSIENDQMTMKGRSLYYGEMWISLTNKQVEYASMVEDVVMKLKSSLFPDEQLIDLQREIVFDKINNF